MQTVNIHCPNCQHTPLDLWPDRVVLATQFPKKGRAAIVQQNAALKYVTQIREIAFSVDVLRCPKCDYEFIPMQYSKTGSYKVS